MEINVSSGEFRKLVNDVAMIKAFLLSGQRDPEGELSDWAKNELEEARKIPNSENVSLGDFKKRILKK